jgi:hypothetical protein
MSTETLRISPNYTVAHWEALDQTNATHWPDAVAIVRDRLEGRFLRYADQVLSDIHSGFVVLAIDCLVAETIQQFTEGIEFSKNPSGVFKRFLGRPQFRPYFTPEPVRDDFYDDIRCGLLHQAEAKNQWRVRRDQEQLLTRVGTGYIINVLLFHAAIKATLDDYLAQLLLAENNELREKLWTKMGFICDVRKARVEEEDAAAAPNPSIN